MSVSDNNNRKGSNNMEVDEAAIGRSDVQGGDSPREGGLPATGTQDLETA